jgi:hypothetical protein
MRPTCDSQHEADADQECADQDEQFAKLRHILIVVERSCAGAERLRRKTAGFSVQPAKAKHPALVMRCRPTIIPPCTQLWVAGKFGSEAFHSRAFPGKISPMRSNLDFPQGRIRCLRSLAAFQILLPIAVEGKSASDLEAFQAR